MSAVIDQADLADNVAPVPLDATARQLQHELLVDVSRTFALTIPRLPPDLADVVGNAYLLCRIVDTVEDELHTDETTRDRMYAGFIACLTEECLPSVRHAEDFAAELSALLPPDAPAGEIRLIAKVPDILKITAGFTLEQRTVLRQCVEVMTAGMREFAAPGASGQGLQDQAMLERYCYHVAGCVGELLTELFCLHDPAIAARRTELLSLSRAFGRGLQLTNILKDMWIDQQRGVCWLPQDRFDTPTGSSASGTRVRPAVTRLMQQAIDGDSAATKLIESGTTELVAYCRADLDLAMRYVRSIPRSHRGLRVFCLWSIGLSVLTLRKIQRQSIEQRRSGTKVSRNSVRATLILSGASAGLAPVMQGLYKVACIGLPVKRKP